MESGIKDLFYFVFKLPFDFDGWGCGADCFGMVDGLYGRTFDTFTTGWILIDFDNPNFTAFDDLISVMG